MMTKLYAWWQDAMCVNNLPKMAIDSPVAGIEVTCVLQSQVQRPNHCATEPHMNNSTPVSCVFEVSNTQGSNITVCRTLQFSLLYKHLYWLPSKYCGAD